MTIKDNRSTSILKITLNLTIASLISGIVIASVYFVTEPYAKKQRVKLKNMAMKELIPSATNFNPIRNREDWYSAENNGNLIAYIISAEGRGYGGTIKILIAVDMQEQIINYKILSHNETPGLGDQADLPKFKNQFEGKKIDNLEVVKNHEDGKIDAITGATITSTAVTKAIKASLMELNEYKAMR